MTDLMVPTETQEQPPIHLTMGFQADPIDYLLILLKTTFLTIITLGLYYPWARAERLRYVMNHTKLGGHDFSFTGNGKEIAIGYLKGLVIYGLIYAGSTYGTRATAESPVLGGILSVLFLVLFYGLLPLAIWGGKAYRLSRTRYRSIYFSIDRQQRKAFLKRYFLDLLLVPLTLGFYTPVLSYNLYKNTTNATRWGNQNFRFKGRLEDSYGLAVKNFLLTNITCGIYLPFAIANRINFDTNNTEIGEGVRIESTLTGGLVFQLILVPLLLTTITLGLAYPWVSIWARQRLLQHFSVKGTIDLSQVRQNKDVASAAGETMGDLWNVDMSMGV